MNRLIIAGTTAIAVVLGGQAIAQSVNVEINPEQRTRIKEYVVKEKVRPVTTIKEQRVTRGYKAPAEVGVGEARGDGGPSLSKYRYFYHDTRVPFVAPASR